MTHLRSALALALLALGFTAVPLAAAAAGPSPSVIGGTAVAQGGFPFAAYVFASTGGNAGQDCTGSVIAPTVILTAAHCVFNAGAVLPATAFAVTTGTVNRPTGATAPNVRSVVADPYYNPSTFQNDAALLVLTTPTTAPAIALATAASGSLYTANTSVTYAGWGETQPDDESSVPAQLQSGTAPILPNATCQTAVQFHPGVTLCVGGPGYRPATCHGDSGGPLVESTPAGLVQIGITSYGAITGCGIAPDYFTRVSSVQGWIAAALAGTPAPPAFVPPFNATAAPGATLSADSVTATFAAPAADPATLPTGFSVSLVGSNGAAVATQTLPVTATSASFPTVLPGTYTVSVVAAYSEGSSAAAVSAAITLKPPTRKTKPTLIGTQAVGARLGCKNGSWNWAGGATYSVAWLRNGKAIAGQHSTLYSVKKADVGKRLICQITLHATSGATASAETRSVLAGVKLRLAKVPKLTGTTTVGSKLVCTAGTWTHTGHLGVQTQWLRNLKVIARATHNRYVPVAADRGKQLACKVTVTATGQSIWYRTASRLVR
jgi:secreted trypsin-like serine protease